MNYKEHLAEKMKNPEFKAFEEEKRLLELSCAIIEAREKCGLTKKEESSVSSVVK